MFSSKLFGLVLSSFLALTPVNFYIPTETTFPFTRQDRAEWRVSWDIDDLGTIAPASTQHNYVINYQADIYCTSACTVIWPTSSDTDFSGYNMTTDHIVWHWYARVNEQTPAAFLQSLSGFNATGSQTGNHTYTSEGDWANMTLSIQYPNNGTLNLSIAFPAVTEGMVMNNNAYWTEELYFLTLANALRDTKDIPSSVMQQYTQYINDGDYSQAIEYISNYYQTTNVNNNEETLQVINNYSDHETDLHDVTIDEHNFSVDIETDFDDQMLNIDTTNLTGISAFQQSAVWVTDKFNRFTVNNAFGSILGFSLLVGLGMAIIGRIIK